METTTKYVRDVVVGDVVSTYRTRGTDDPRLAPWRGRWARVPDRVRLALAGVVVVGGFIIGSWGDGPYEQPVHTVPAPCWAHILPVPPGC
jgi:hypothetical protein